MEKKRIKCVGEEIEPSDPIYYPKFSHLQQYRQFTINKVFFKVGDFVIIEKNKRPPPVERGGHSPKIAQIYRVFKSGEYVFALAQWFTLARHIPKQLLNNFPPEYPSLDRKREVLCDRRYIVDYGQIDINDILDFTSVVDIPRDADPKQSAEERNAIYVTRFGIKESASGIRLVKVEDFPSSDQRNKTQQTEVQNKDFPVSQRNKTQQNRSESERQFRKPSLDIQFVKHQIKIKVTPSKSPKLKPISPPPSESDFELRPLRATRQTRPVSSPTSKSVLRSARQTRPVLPPPFESDFEVSPVRSTRQTRQVSPPTSKSVLKSARQTRQISPPASESDFEVSPVRSSRQTRQVSTPASQTEQKSTPKTRQASPTASESDFEVSPLRSTRQTRQVSTPASKSVLRSTRQTRQASPHASESDFEVSPLRSTRQTRPVSPPPFESDFEVSPVRSTRQTRQVSPPTSKSVLRSTRQTRPVSGPLSDSDFEVRPVRTTRKTRQVSSPTSETSEYKASESSGEESEVKFEQRKTPQKRKLFKAESQNIPPFSQTMLRSSQSSNSKETDKMKPNTWQQNGDVMDEPGPSESVKLTPRKCRIIQKDEPGPSMKISPRKSRRIEVEDEPGPSESVKVSPRKCRQDSWSAKIITRSPDKSPVRMKLVKCNPDEAVVAKLDFEDKMERRRQNRPPRTIMEDTPDSYNTPVDYIFPKRAPKKDLISRAQVASSDDDDDDFSMDEFKKKSPKQKSIKDFIQPSTSAGKLKLKHLIGDKIKMVDLEAEPRQTRARQSTSLSNEAAGPKRKDSLSSVSVISASEDEVGRKTRASMSVHDTARQSTSLSNGEETKTGPQRKNSFSSVSVISASDVEVGRKTRASMSVHDTARPSMSITLEESKKTRASFSLNDRIQPNVSLNDTSRGEESKTKASLTKNDAQSSETSLQDGTRTEQNKDEGQRKTRMHQNSDIRVDVFKKPNLNSSSSTISSCLMPLDSSTPVTGSKNVRRQPSVSSDYSPDIPISKPGKCKTKTNYTIVEDSFEDLNSSKTRKFFKSPDKEDVTVISAQIISPRRNAVKPSPGKNNAKFGQSPGKNNAKLTQSPAKKDVLFFEEEENLTQKKSPYKGARFFIATEKDIKKPVLKKKMTIFEDSDSENSPQVERVREQSEQLGNSPKVKRIRHQLEQPVQLEQHEQPGNSPTVKRTRHQLEQLEQPVQPVHLDEDMNTPDDAPVETTIPMLQPVIKLCKMSQSFIERYTLPDHDSQTSSSSAEVSSTPAVQTSKKVTSDVTETSDEENPIPKSLRNELKSNKSISIISPNVKPTPESAKRVLNMLEDEEDVHPVLKLLDKNIALRGSPSKSILTPEYVTPENITPGKSPRKRSKSRSSSEGVNSLNRLQSLSCENLKSSANSSTSEYLTPSMSNLISEDEKACDSSPHIISDSEGEQLNSAQVLRSLRSKVQEKMDCVDNESTNLRSPEKSSLDESNLVFSLRSKMMEKMQEKSEKSPTKKQEVNHFEGERKFSFRRRNTQESQDKSLRSMDSQAGQSKSSSSIETQQSIPSTSQQKYESPRYVQPKSASSSLCVDLCFSDSEEEVHRATRSSPLKLPTHTKLSNLEDSRGTVRQSPRKPPASAVSETDDKRNQTRARNQDTTSPFHHMPRSSSRHGYSSPAKTLVNKPLESVRANSTPELNTQDFLCVFDTPDPSFDPKSPVKLPVGDISDTEANDISMCIFESQDVSFARKSPAKLPSKKFNYDDVINDAHNFLLNSPFEVTPPKLEARKSPRKMTSMNTAQENANQVSVRTRDKTPVKNPFARDEKMREQSSDNQIPLGKRQSPRKSEHEREQTPECDTSPKTRLTPRKTQHEREHTPEKQGSVRQSPRKTQHETTPEKQGSARQSPRKTQHEREHTPEKQGSVRQSPRKNQHETTPEKQGRVRQSPRKNQHEATPEKQGSVRQSPRKISDQSSSPSLNRIILKLNLNQSPSSSPGSSRRKQQLSSRNASEEIIPETKIQEKRKRGRPSKSSQESEDISPPKKTKSVSDNSDSDATIIAPLSPKYQKRLNKDEISQNILDEDDYFDVTAPLNDNKVSDFQGRSSPFPLASSQLNLKMNYKSKMEERREQRKLDKQKNELLYNTLKKRTETVLNGGVVPKVPALIIPKSKILPHKNVENCFLSENGKRNKLSERNDSSLSSGRSSRVSATSYNEQYTDEEEETPKKSKQRKTKASTPKTPKTKVSTPKRGTPKVKASCDTTPSRKATPSRQVNTPTRQGTPSRCETPKSRGRPSKGRPNTPKSESKKGKLGSAKKPVSAKKSKRRRGVQGETEIEEQEMPGRETQMDTIQKFVESKIHDRGGGCMYISGVPGTGKTASVTQVVRRLMQLKEEEELPDFKLVQVSGMELTQPQQVFSRMADSLFGLKMSSSLAQTKLETYFKNKDKNRPATILIIDELDMLCTRRQDVVYNLFDWPAQTNARLIVLAIANTMDLPERLLKGKVTSRLGLTRITFQPYSFAQLQKIVAVKLYNADMFDSDAVQLVARKVASVSGDARRALDICRRAAELVDAGDSVQISHVMKALAEMLESPVIETVRNCNMLMKFFLRCLMSEMRRTGLEESTFEDVYNVMKEDEFFSGIEKCSMSQVSDVCAQLSAMRLILAEDGHGNIKQRLALNVSVDELHYALEEH